MKEPLRKAVSGAIDFVVASPLVHMVVVCLLTALLTPHLIRSNILSAGKSLEKLIETLRQLIDLDFTELKE
jgi:amino acid permease